MKNHTTPSIKSTIVDWDYKYYVVDTIQKKYIYGFSSHKEADAYANVCKRNGIQAKVLPAAEIESSDSFGPPNSLANWSEYYPESKILDE